MIATSDSRHDRLTSGRVAREARGDSDRWRHWTVSERAVRLRPHDVRTEGLKIVGASADDRACDTSVSNRTGEEGDAVARVRWRFRSRGPGADGDHERTTTDGGFSCGTRDTAASRVVWAPRPSLSA